MSLPLQAEHWGGAGFPASRELMGFCVIGTSLLA
jgi:hypothetical protein